jgi:hypothetical protein
MNHLSEKDRARITVILARLISELVGGDEELDERTANVISEIFAFWRWVNS